MKVDVAIVGAGPSGLVFELLSVDHPTTVGIIVAGNPDAVVAP